MTLVRTGQGVTDIRGSLGGVYFTRDKFGLHCSAKPRRVDQGTPAQQKQRAAFIKARTFCRNELFADKPKNWLNRCTSYNIYRALNDLYIGFLTIVTGELDPNSTGTYELAGTHKNKDYYKREDSVFFIWWNGYDSWLITKILGVPVGVLWQRLAPDISGIYIPKGGASGIATVTLSSTEPPVDYQIPKL